jgi:hypothetical protein
VLLELAALLTVAWWLNGCSSSTITTTATATAADRTDQNRGARDRWPPFPGRSGGPGGMNGPDGAGGQDGPAGGGSNGGRYGGWLGYGIGGCC